MNLKPRALEKELAATNKSISLLTERRDALSTLLDHCLGDLGGPQPMSGEPTPKKAKKETKNATKMPGGFLPFSAERELVATDSITSDEWQFVSAAEILWRLFPLLPPAFNVQIALNLTKGMTHGALANPISRGSRKKLRDRFVTALYQNERLENTYRRDTRPGWFQKKFVAVGDINSPRTRWTPPPESPKSPKSPDKGLDTTV
jgi:hypothetical protein